MSDLQELLDSFIKERILDEEEDRFFKSSYEKLEQWYRQSFTKNPKYRHSYYELSKFLEDKQPDERESLAQILDKTYEMADRDDNLKDDRIVSSIYKLCDHVNLEMVRIARVEKSIYSYETLQTQREKIEKDAKQISKDISIAKRKIRSLNSNVITILGIFAGLVLGFSSEFELLKQAFANINNMYFDKLLVYAITIGIILFDTVFLIMYCISKISDTSISHGCYNKKCTDCIQQCKFFKKIHKKYPYVLYYNVLSVILIISFILYHIFKKY